MIDRQTGLPVAAISICSASSTVKERHGQTLIRAVDELSRRWTSSRQTEPGRFDDPRSRAALAVGVLGGLAVPAGRAITGKVAFLDTGLVEGPGSLADA